MRPSLSLPLALAALALSIAGSFGVESALAQHRERTIAVPPAATQDEQASLVKATEDWNATGATPFQLKVLPPHHWRIAQYQIAFVTRENMIAGHAMCEAHVLSFKIYCQTPAVLAAARCSLTAAIAHELGHVFGFGHRRKGLMHEHCPAIYPGIDAGMVEELARMYPKLPPGNSVEEVAAILGGRKK